MDVVKDHLGFKVLGMALHTAIRSEPVRPYVSPGQLSGSVVVPKARLAASPYQQRLKVGTGTVHRSSPACSIRTQNNQLPMVLHTAVHDGSFLLSWYLRMRPVHFRSGLLTDQPHCRLTAQAISWDGRFHSYRSSRRRYRSTHQALSRPAIAQVRHQTYDPCANPGRRTGQP